MGEAYGMLPTDVMRRPAWEFWMNAEIRHATESFKEDARERGQDAQTGAGVASASEKQELVEANEDRADRREDLGDSQPALTEQMEAIRQAHAEADGDGGS